MGGETRGATTRLPTGSKTLAWRESKDDAHTMQKRANSARAGHRGSTKVALAIGLTFSGLTAGGVATGGH